MFDSIYLLLASLNLGSSNARPLQFLSFDLWTIFHFLLVFSFAGSTTKVELMSVPLS